MAGNQGPADSDHSGRFDRAWRAFGHWRHTRPFLGGLLVTLGGAEILLTERAPLPIVIHIGLQGLAGYLVPIVLLLCGLLLLFHPVQRIFYSLLAVVLSLAAWVTSNLGGFFAGMLLGLIGGAVAFAWTQREERVPAQHRDRPPQRRIRIGGLALIRGEHRSDSSRQADSSGDQDAQAGRWPGTDPVGSAWFRARSPAQLAPIALSAALAAVAARGLVLAAMPASASAVTPNSPWMLSPSPSPSATPSPSPSASPSPRPSGTPSSAPTAHPPRRILAAARPAVPIAADQSSLAARFAILTGVSYDGIAAVPTAHGTEPMLKFSMSSLKLPGTMLSVSDGGGSFLTMDSSLILRGHVELYTTQLSGVLSGVKVTFSPANPPTALGHDITLTSIVALQPFATANSEHAVGSMLDSR